MDSLQIYNKTLARIKGDKNMNDKGINIGQLISSSERIGMIEYGGK